MKREFKITATIDPEFYKKIEHARKQIQALSITLNKIDRRSKIEKAYDLVTNFLSGGKSFSPNELRSF